MSVFCSLLSIFVGKDLLEGWAGNSATGPHRNYAKHKANECNDLTWFMRAGARLPKASDIYWINHRYKSVKQLDSR
jgi:hypothetical protein